MRDALKKAGLQNPVLTDRNRIRGLKRRVSKHTFAKPAANNPLRVDAAGIGGRNMLLPGEVSLCLEHGEKSAEAIVAARNERRKHCGGLTGR